MYEYNLSFLFKDGYEEAIWWLESSHHIPMDVIRHIMTEWVLYPPIEDNEKFRECISLWFNKTEEKLKERNAMIKKYGHISFWNTKNITDMSSAFYKNCTQRSYSTILENQNFSEDLSQWNVSNVTNMSNMFIGCLSFSCNLSHWDVRNVTDMSGMFAYCSQFDSDLSLWNVSNVVNMQNMFNNCTKLKKECISQWKISDTTDTTDTKNMFDEFLFVDNLDWIP